MGFLDLEFKQPRSGSSATPSCQGHRPQGAKKNGTFEGIMGCTSQSNQDIGGINELRRPPPLTHKGGGAGGFGLESPILGNILFLVCFISFYIYGFANSDMGFTKSL